MSRPETEMNDDMMSQLLLDYAKGRLSAEDRLVVEASIADNMDQAKELAFYQGLAKTVVNNVDQTAVAPNELGWARLSKAIDAEENAKQAVHTPDISHHAHQSAHKPAANSNQPFWRIAAMVAGVLALGQSAMLVNIGMNKQTDESLYVSVAETKPSFDTKIIFKKDAVEADISALLRSNHGEIVQGPSSLGVYTVRFKSDEARKEGLSSFLKSSHIVESATH